jgi:hypothetical protein
MSDIKVTVVDGNNVNLLVTPTPRNIINVDRGQFGPTGPYGPTGPTGPQGEGIALKGSVPTISDLPSSGNVVGDSYIVTEDGHLYTWNGSTWADDGPIVGPTGAAGPTGPTGPQGQGLEITGSVSTPADLPTVGQTGDQYFVQSTGTVYIWSNT